MTMILVRYRVKDYAAWKSTFDQHASPRRAAGCRGETVYRSANDPNGILIVFEWDNAENAERFGASPELKAMMEKAGVIGAPEAWVATEMAHAAK